MRHFPHNLAGVAFVAASVYLSAALWEMQPLIAVIVHAAFITDWWCSEVEA